MTAGEPQGQGTSKRAATVKAAFGARNRQRLIDAYFENDPAPTSDTAWAHVYTLLLWIDRTTGLAHCYESDKSQPGKPWYPRSLVFHGWVSQQFNTAPNELGDVLDWLFRKATLDLASTLLARQAKTIAKAQQQRAPYAGLNFPEPGEDPELIAIVQDVLGEYFTSAPSDEDWRELVQRLRGHVTLENKRKNLVGEGFEDVLASVIARVAGAGAVEVTARKLLQTIQGFENERRGEKANKVDVVVLRPSDGKRTLVTAKWSIRADREKQFATEFASYVNAKSDVKPFDYVLVTNEFDPARLVRACEAMATHSHMFSQVVHISPAALRATYGPSPEETMRKVIEFIDTGRLLGLGDWIRSLPGE